MSNEMREEFERVAALEGLNIAHHPQFHGDYLALDTQWRWLGFKHGQMVATAAAEAKSGWCICRCGANPISHSNINGVQTYSCPLCKAVCVITKTKDTTAAAEAKYLVTGEATPSWCCQAATAAAEAKLVQAIHDRDHAERQLAKVAAENMRLREAEAKYREVLEKLVTRAHSLIEECDRSRAGISDAGFNPAVLAMLDTIALTAPLVGGK